MVPSDKKHQSRAIQEEIHDLEELMKVMPSDANNNQEQLKRSMILRSFIKVMPSDANNNREQLKRYMILRSFIKVMPSDASSNQK
jgi:translation elongation factor EF-1beta